VEKFLECIAAVESSRAFRPPVFADIRISRSVRAVGFNGKNFEKFVSEGRYHWMKGLGNRAVIEKKHVMQIDNPKAAVDLLDLAIECAKEGRRVIFFCACEFPVFCHRAEVAKLANRLAKGRGLNLEVVEWPGGEPENIALRVPKGALALSRSAAFLPLGKEVDLGLIGSTPWGSTVTAFSQDRAMSFKSGPARFRQAQWCLPVIERFDDTLEIKKWLRTDVMNWRKENGYSPLKTGE